ncbi:curli-like amyloid fiber formation chaperone CsgH [Roseicyclus persicicus]|uniref:CsgH-like domain-containing protein n=1 Tax=Roseicyclus persicicus TaxID=2650661 RepID=A0A7X6H0M6_9RHOB|nr:curli-like amyloid fiber formation chaperone CsgH [Roseibacterium persicicum]NKX45023.1 hypothetical protein [Roseibacterium persicicum]
MTFPLSKAVLAPALTAVALGCTAIAGQTGATAEGPLACSVDVTARNGMLTIAGVVSSDAAVSGVYQLRVSRAGTLMNQGGPFRLAAGQTERLGQVMLNGPASGLDVALTLEVDGDTLRCPVDL